MLKGSLKITDDSVFAKAAMDAASKLKFSSSKDIRPEIMAIVTRALNDSPTVKELRSGKLRDDFGIFGNMVDVAINGIIKILVDNLDVQPSKSSKKKGSASSVNLMPADISVLTSVEGGSYQTESGDINWMDWLLTKGSRVIIKDFWLFTHAKGTTRSGGKEVMVKISENKRDPFRVEPQHAGTRTNNFITRALDTVNDDIALVIAQSYTVGGG